VTELGSRLRGLAKAPEPQPLEVEEERCDLCGEPVPAVHRHLIDVDDRRLLCACRPCTILFDHTGAGGGHFRLLPDRTRALAGFDLDDTLWRSLDIPVELAFFFYSSAAGKVVAFYPAPAGATESLLQLEAWDELVRRNPVLEELEPDVEALLVDRTGGAGRHRHWLVPVDRCYELVGLIRTHWKGFRGGSELWEQVETFFDQLGREAVTVTNDGKEAAWR
jgi:Family of unknown function (DUF5947)